MTNLAVMNSRLPSMSMSDIDKVRSLEAVVREIPQVDIATDHVLHAGMYARTICIPAGVVLTGVFIRIPTLLVLSGHCAVYLGEQTVEFSGYNVLTASAHRRQAFVAHTDTYLTMSFPTQAETVEEAENEFTDETHLLFSRKDGAKNHITITKEQ